MRTLAIIPARSGSKGLKDKNIKLLNGKPMIAYSIMAAQEAKIFDEIMVSTDSEQYAQIAMDWGANVPFLRSEKTSTDSASSMDMIIEVLEGYKKIGKEYDSFCLLQPTSPLRNARDIVEAYDLFCKKAKYAVVSVCEAEHSPLWCGQLPADCQLKGFVNRDDIKQRQKNGRYYRINGAIYIVNISKYREDPFFYREGSYAYIMPQSRSVDIDNEIDFKLAEIFLADGYASD